MREAALLSIALLAAACSGTGETSAARGEDVPVAAGSETPDLHVTPDGRLLLSWVESGADGSALRFAVRGADGWAEPRTVARGTDWLVHPADFASVRAGAGGALAAHWRVNTGGHAVHVRVSASPDGGLNWSPPVLLHGDDSATEHGFVTIVPTGDDFVAVWLDGRGTAADPGSGGGAMSLRAAVLRRDGRVEAETLLDDRTCDCCPTDAVVGQAAVVAAYRDRSESEVRDISVCRMDLATGRWSGPDGLHADGWTIAGCPVDGPALAAAGARIACAWFTAGSTGEEPQVNVALSSDDGKTFGEPLRIDLGDPVGRPDLAAAADGGWRASWIERQDDAFEIRVRRITAEGRMDPSHVVISLADGRAVGFPRLAGGDGGNWIAWTEPGDAPRVRVARIP